ncbi:MAG TPA: hypothetical protein VLL74_02310 [Methanoregula sp.]|nr:hypothetical protein [Methanoregula sp.]
MTLTVKAKPVLPVFKMSIRPKDDERADAGDPREGRLIIAADRLSTKTLQAGLSGRHACVFLPV